MIFNRTAAVAVWFSVGQEEIMNCFIASAFDHDDIDAVYDDAIRPVLKELKLHPLRVDRVEHNDDIDDRIFRLIDQSHVCIADLTHARPSVYYEAGYAFGSGKPVIYISRSDHFRARENDEAGNLRVHFDLQMKNIIRWTEPNAAFKKRIRARLRHALKPMLRAEQAAAREREHEESFSRLSQNERLKALRTKAESILRHRGYSCGRFPEHRPSGRDPYHAHFERTRDKTYQQIHLLVRPSVTKPGLQILGFLWIPMITREAYQAAKRLESVCIIISLGSARRATLSSIFPNWTPVDDKTYTRDDIRGMREELPHTATIVVLDNIRSVKHFDEDLCAALEKWEANRKQSIAQSRRG